MTMVKSIYPNHKSSSSRDLKKTLKDKGPVEERRKFRILQKDKGYCGILDFILPCQVSCTKCKPCMKPTKKMGLASSSVKPICIEEERQALVRFKQDLKVLFGKLSFWVSHDCCQWEGIMQQPHRVESIYPTLKR